MALSLLVGNGINRVTNQDAAWEQVLRALCVNELSRYELEHVKHKPFALLYEEIVFAHSRPGKVADLESKRRVANLVSSFEPNEFHRRLMRAPVKHVLTTNYDYTLERATRSSPIRSNLMSESKYSAFRRRTVDQMHVWHIHGESEAPNTITLGYDQYSGYLQKLRAYATSERDGKKGSPFKRGERHFDALDAGPYSWLDVFFRDDVHIVGCGLDFTEIDLWWALTYKKKLQILQRSVGRTVFHCWYSGELDESSTAKNSLLAALGVEVESRDCSGGFEAAYDQLLGETFGV